MNLTKAWEHLLNAIRHSAKACERTKHLVRVAIARYSALVLLAKVSA